VAGEVIVMNPSLLTALQLPEQPAGVPATVTMPFPPEPGKGGLVLGLIEYSHIGRGG
jgi:hypothetical protein